MSGISISPTDIIRPGTMGDYRALARIEQSCFADNAWDEEDVICLLGTSLEEPRLVLLVAFAKAAQTRRAKGEIAGYVVGEVDDDFHGDIMELAVLESHRGRKIGRALLERVCAGLRQAGARDIALQVPIGQQAAIHLYESVGFVTEFLPDHYKPGDGYAMTRFYPAAARPG